MKPGPTLPLSRGSFDEDREGAGSLLALSIYPLTINYKVIGTSSCLCLFFDNNFPCSDTYPFALFAIDKAKQAARGHHALSHHPKGPVQRVLEKGCRVLPWNHAPSKPHQLRHGVAGASVAFSQVRGLYCERKVRLYRPIFRLNSELVSSAFVRSSSWR